MAHKVVICGINTSALPKLTGKEALSLMRKVKEGDELARQKFITSNLRLVLSVVQRYAGKGKTWTICFRWAAWDLSSRWTISTYLLT